MIDSPGGASLIRRPRTTVFELHSRGRTQVQRAGCELDDVNDVIGQVLDGSAPAPRMVFRFDASAPDLAQQSQFVEQLSR